MQKLLRINNVLKHSEISAHSLDLKETYVNKASKTKFSRDNGLVSKINMNSSKIQEQDYGGFDYGRLVAIIAKG